MCMKVKLQIFYYDDHKRKENTKVMSRQNLIKESAFYSLPLVDHDLEELPPIQWFEKKNAASIYVNVNVTFIVTDLLLPKICKMVLKKVGQLKAFPKNVICFEGTVTGQPAELYFRRQLKLCGCDCCFTADTSE